MGGGSTEPLGQAGGRPVESGVGRIDGAWGARDLASGSRVAVPVGK
ncbi:hypothetical protein N007_13235 [Alicyclobacillus acidoterrestris ATCC 49025]|nr:hypothetical protein N007_13235 [Alicyclobacillus acidoterrestris ATCC 49025]